MKKKLMGAALLFCAGLVGAAVLLIVRVGKGERRTTADFVVAINEMEQLCLAGETEKITEKSALFKEELHAFTGEEKKDFTPFALCALSIFFVLSAFCYLYVSVLRPFERLESFAGQISAGNFDIPLDMERSGYFGAFTWAFDSMRREITKARACEREAVENNKTVIATLSHDIKTPIASIRAYCEGLEAALDGTPEKRRRYLNVIMKKCDEVSRLTNDLFLHSLSDLDRLQIVCETFDFCSFIQSAVRKSEKPKRMSVL